MFTKMYPELHVSDVEKAVASFTDSLELETGFKFEDEGVLDFAVLNHGDLMLYTICCLMMSPTTQSAVGYTSNHETFLISRGA